MRLAPIPLNSAPQLTQMHQKKKKTPKKTKTKQKNL